MAAVIYEGIVRTLSEFLFHRISLLHILLFGALLRAIGLVTASIIEVDGTVYARMGESFARGDLAQGLRGAFPPVFPVLLGLFHLVVPDIELAGRLVSFVFGVLLIYIVYLFMKKFFDEKHALLGAFFVAIHPYLVKYSVPVLTESVATFLFVTATFLFYKGWIEDCATDVALSGVMLGLTYLTRPEYIVFFAPMGLILLWKRKFIQTFVFLCCFFAFVLAYVYYMKWETGLVVVSKKAILAKSQTVTGGSHHSYLLPILPITTTLRHIPFVLLNFIKAQFLPFFVLAIMGFRSMDGRYLILTVSLIILHVLSIATISESTVRFSVEFVPLVLPFSVMGLGVFNKYLQRYRCRRFLYSSAIVILVGSSLVIGYSSPDKGRVIHKDAGLYLKQMDPGKVVASRLPFVPFYSRGKWAVTPVVKDCKQLLDAAKKSEAAYLVIDDGMLRKNITIEDCLTSLITVKEFRDGGDFVTIYRLQNE